MPMIKYANHSGKSGVEAYDARTSSMDIKFKDADEIYTFKSLWIGSDNMANMRRLAKLGIGLNTYLNKHVIPLNED